MSGVSERVAEDANSAPVTAPTTTIVTRGAAASAGRARRMRSARAPLLSSSCVATVSGDGGGDGGSGSTIDALMRCIASVRAQAVTVLASLKKRQHRLAMSVNVDDDGDDDDDDDYDTDDDPDDDKKLGTTTSALLRGLEELRESAHTHAHAHAHAPVTTHADIMDAMLSTFSDTCLDVLVLHATMRRARRRFVELVRGVVGCGQRAVAPLLHLARERGIAAPSLWLLCGMLTEQPFASTETKTRMWLDAGAQVLQWALEDAGSARSLTAQWALLMMHTHIAAPCLPWLTTPMLSVRSVLVCSEIISAAFTLLQALARGVPERINDVVAPEMQQLAVRLEFVHGVLGAMDAASVIVHTLALGRVDAATRALETELQILADRYACGGEACVRATRCAVGAAVRAATHILRLMATQRALVFGRPFVVTHMPLAVTAVTATTATTAAVTP